MNSKGLIEGVWRIETLVTTGIFAILAVFAVITTLKASDEMGKNRGICVSLASDSYQSDYQFKQTLEECSNMQEFGNTRTINAFCSDNYAYISNNRKQFTIKKEQCINSLTK